MVQVLDQTQDLTGTETQRLISIHEPPAFVKQAAHEQTCGDPAKIPGQLYADVANRHYPCHTAAATWLSTLFFVTKRAGEQTPETAVIDCRLAAAARRLGIQHDIAALVEKAAAAATAALEQLPDTDYALVWVVDGHKERHLPLRHTQEVKTAAAWFNKYRDEYPFADRQQIAAKILEKSGVLDVTLASCDVLEKTAGYGHCAAQDIVELLRQRAAFVARTYPPFAAEFEKLAKIVAAHPTRARAQGIRMKLAAQIDQFDRLAKLTRFYDQGLPRPEEVLFQVTEKHATDFVQRHVGLANGSIYEKDALAQLEPDQLQDWLGEEVAQQVVSGGLFVDTEKLAATLISLSAADADMFDRLTAATGLAPVMYDKAAETRGLAPETLRQLADAYAAKE